VKEAAMEWLREVQWLWWVGAALALGLIEIASLDLVFTMLAIAALAAAGAAALGLGFPAQVIVFVLTSALLLAVLRPLALRKLKPAGPGERTNTAAHLGRRVEVLEPVSERSGLVKLAGEAWTARTEASGVTYDAGEYLQVVRIEGATAVVAPLPAADETAPPDPT
jgi:membrane protein implicated in regulation of membrane protease activity